MGPSSRCAPSAPKSSSEPQTRADTPAPARRALEGMTERPRTTPETQRRSPGPIGPGLLCARLLRSGYQITYRREPGASVTSRRC